jgi:hypothetical protein
MSRVRRVSQPDDSLELLLDTICNTFGGIVFMALLVSVLIGQRSNEVSTQSVDDSQQAEMQRLMAELTNQNQNFIQLQSTSDLLDKISKSVDDPKMKSLIVQKERLENAVERLQSQVSANLVEVSKDQSDVNKRANHLSELKKMLDAARAELNKLKSDLEQSEKANSRVFGFPIVHSTSKMQISVAIKNNRYCFLDKITATGTTEDPEQVSISENKIGGRILTPRFENGLILNQNNLKPLNDRIGQISPSEYIVSLFVWDDSIKAFQELTDILVARRIRYEIVVMTDGDLIRSAKREQIFVQ